MYHNRGGHRPWGGAASSPRDLTGLPWGGRPGKDEEELARWDVLRKSSWWGDNECRNMDADSRRSGSLGVECMATHRDAACPGWLELSEMGSCSRLMSRDWAELRPTFQKEAICQPMDFPSQPQHWLRFQRLYRLRLYNLSIPTSQMDGKMYKLNK